MLPGWSHGWAGYFHVTLVCALERVTSRPQLSRTRYEKLELSVDGSQASETLYDVLPVERRFRGFVGAFLSPDRASSGEPGAAIDGASGSVASRQAAAVTRIAAIKAYETDCRRANMGASLVTRDVISGSSIGDGAARFPRTGMI